MRRKGTNQHQVKWRILKPEAWASVWFIAFITILGAWIIQPKIISPCPDTGCFVEVVYANESPDEATVRERVLLAGMRVFGTRHVESLEKLVFKESTFNQYAINPSSGACGLFQAWPCKKLGCKLDDVDCQIDWGLHYLKNRYGDPSRAWAFHQRNGWY